MHLPEFWKKRPVIIISYRNQIDGSVTVVPCSSEKENIHNAWAIPLEETINPKDGKNSYAICDKITTVATSRLSLPIDGFKRVSEKDFKTILEKIFLWLPQKT